MSRTWLLRGCAVAVLAVLAGAWAVGLVGIGDSPSPAAEPDRPRSSDSSTEPEKQRPVIREGVKQRKARKADPSREATTDPTTDPTTDVPDEPGDAPSTSDPTVPSTPDDPDPTDKPSDPPPSPTNPPSNPPSQPADECTDLGGVINCALDPVTGGP